MLEDRFPEIIARMPETVAAAALEAGQLVEQSAKDRVPVRTGKLRDAIHIVQDEEGSHVVAGDKTAWYGHIVEHGSVNTPAHPFLVPALEENRAAVVAIVERAVGRL